MVLFVERMERYIEPAKLKLFNFTVVQVNKSIPAMMVHRFDFCDNIQRKPTSCKQREICETMNYLRREGALHRMVGS